ncbi:MAG TPA: hypothetical protein VK789_34120 [Bryobacteraceae bacterium]|jgi:hypothetical protein|nr:hypothetical protein [Bryobacteraceae bacterium]
MKKTAGLLILLAFCLMAADFWKKPYTEWSDKDVTKMMTDSPWAKSASITMSFPGGGGAAPAFGGGGGGRGGGRGGPEGDQGPPPPPSIEIVARCESALPMRQALVRKKFGAEAEKSADAQKVLAEEPNSYEIVLSGSMGMFLRGGPDQLKQSLTEVTSLSTPRTGAIKPTTIEIGPPGKTMDVLFVFPRSMPFTVDDKEVEFATKLGTSNVKYKFRLKDMLVNGKPEM